MLFPPHCDELTVVTENNKDFALIQSVCKVKFVSGDEFFGAQMNAVCQTVRAEEIFMIELPELTAIVEAEDDAFVARCPELGVVSQGDTVAEAHAMLQEAVELLLEVADEEEIARRLSAGAHVLPLELAA